MKNTLEDNSLQRHVVKYEHHIKGSFPEIRKALQAAIKFNKKK